MSLDEVDEDEEEDWPEEYQLTPLYAAFFKEETDEQDEERKDQETELPPEEQLERTVEVWQFVTAADERVCPICSARDGEIYSGADMDMLFPGAEAIGDGDVITADLHDNCRCVIVPVDVSEESRAEDGDLDLGVALLAGGAGMMFFGTGSRERRRRRR